MSIESPIPDPAPEVARALGRIGIGLSFAVALAMGVAPLYRWVAGASGPWQVTLFPRDDFSGRPAIEYTRKIDYKWGRQSPRPDDTRFSADDWSAIFRSCLTLEESTKVRFRLTSDDGSRFYIDDDLVVSNWGRHRSRSKAGVRDLEPGVYSLRLDYVEHQGDAKLKLEASFDGGEFKAIPPQDLTRPRDSDAGPCS